LDIAHDAANCFAYHTPIGLALTQFAQRHQNPVCVFVDHNWNDHLLQFASQAAPSTAFASQQHGAARAYGFHAFVPSRTADRLSISRPTILILCSDYHVTTGVENLYNESICVAHSLSTDQMMHMDGCDQIPILCRNFPNSFPLTIEIECAV
jgi:hypothetical protein